MPKTKRTKKKHVDTPRTKELCRNFHSVVEKREREKRVSNLVSLDRVADTESGAGANRHEPVEQGEFDWLLGEFAVAAAGIARGRSTTMFECLLSQSDIGCQDRPFRHFRHRLSEFQFELGFDRQRHP